MKRRSFLIGSSSTLASLAAFRARAATNNATPCPPPSVSVAGGSKVTTVCPSAPSVSGPTSAPAWFSSTPNLQWVAPVSNWLGAAGVLDPLANTTNAGDGPQNILYAYSGMAMDRVTGEIRLLANGGHSNYFGNEVYRVSLQQSQPAWVRLRDATPFQGVGSSGFQGDGRPTAGHTYSTSFGGNGRFIAFGRFGYDPAGDSKANIVVEFVANNPNSNDNVNNDWVNLSSTLNINGSPYPGNQSVFYDEQLNQIILVVGGNVQPSIVVYDATSLKQISANNATLNDGGNELAGAIDTVNRILLIQGNSGYWWIPLSKLASGSWSSFGAPGNNIPSNHGFAFHAASNAFVVYYYKQGLMKLKPTVSGGGYSSLGNWTVVSGVSGPTPQPYFDSGNGEGLNNKCQIVDNMGDGRAGLVYLPAWANPDLYVMPLPTSGL